MPIILATNARLILILLLKLPIKLLKPSPKNIVNRLKYAIKTSPANVYLLFLTPLPIRAVKYELKALISTGLSPINKPANSPVVASQI